MSQALINSLIAILSLGAFLALFVHNYLLKKEKIASSAIFSQGILAIVALVLLFVYLFRPNPGEVESLVLFTIAMSASLVMTARDLAGGAVPKWLSIIHGLLSFGGFTYIFIFTYINQ